MGSKINLLDLYLKGTTDEILTLLDRDNDTYFLNDEWRHALMEEVCNRLIPKIIIKDGTGDNIPMKELPKIKVKTNLERKR